MKRRLHISICSPLIERDDLAVNHGFSGQPGESL
jgi:hypothetical protein